MHGVGRLAGAGFRAPLPDAGVPFIHTYEDPNDDLDDITTDVWNVQNVRRGQRGVAPRRGDLFGTHRDSEARLTSLMNSISATLEEDGANQNRPLVRPQPLAEPWATPKPERRTGTQEARMAAARTPRGPSRAPWLIVALVLACCAAWLLGMQGFLLVRDLNRSAPQPAMPAAPAVEVEARPSNPNVVPLPAAPAPTPAAAAEPTAR